MAKFLNWFNRIKNTAVGELLTAAIYAVMLLLVLIFFTGNGQFIYELS